MKLPLTLTLLGCLLVPQLAIAAENEFSIGGYYKNLFISTRSLATEERIYADINRLRLEAKKDFEPWHFNLTVDNEAIPNDFSNLPDFDIIRSKSQNELASWDADAVSVDEDKFFLRHSVYRAYVQYYQPEFQATLGKQGVDWGKMRFYSPLDLFNPVGPIDLEPLERVGVDAINLDFTPEAFAHANVVAVPNDDSEEASGGIKIYKTLATYDVSLIAAAIREDTIVGTSFDGYVFGAGLRGEFSYTERDNGDDFERAAIGLDYNISEKFYLLIEHFFNGGHDNSNPSVFTTSYRLSREIMSLKKHLTSLFIKTTLTPLLELNNYVIYDWDGRSLVINPELTYNISQNVDVSVGAQLFGGSSDSEFGDSEHLFYAQFKWFF